MNDVVDKNSELVSLERKLLAERVSDDAAEQQADTRAAPDDPDAGSARLKHLFAEESKKDLGSAASGCPSNRQQRNRKHQGYRPHVAQTFAILMPWPHHFDFGQALAF